MHRAIEPKYTIARIDGHWRALGITRLSNITGLDYLGLPVFMATRPNARSISVSLGKGLDDESAAASALMEALEVAHAETIRQPVLRRSYNQLRRSARVADPQRLARMRSAAFDPGQSIEWIEGRDLASSHAVFLPLALVELDYTRPRRKDRGVFAQGSNGLASGNHRNEAVIAGLCEVIERDALALFSAFGARARAARRLKPETILDVDCRRLLDRLSGCKFAVAVWDVTTDIGVPAFLCRIMESVTNEHPVLGAFWGAGCHLDREVAFVRAVTEAAQSRLTLVAGARDDLARRDYDRATAKIPFDHVLDHWEQSVATRQFTQIPSLTARDFSDAIALLLARLDDVGLRQVIAVDLTDARIGIPVVRIVVPGLEAYDPAARIRSGARLRRLRQRCAS